MKIIWKPNPLATIVELDEFDKKLLRQRLEIEDLKERNFSAHFELDPESRAWHNKEIKERSLEEAVTSALKKLDVSYVQGDEKRGTEPKLYSEHLDEEFDLYVKELSAKHCGDCTCVACSCLKCRVEELIGVDTIKGLKKHAAYKIDSAFDTQTGSDDPKILLDRALSTLRNYNPVKPESWSGGNESFQVHVPRWLSEAKEAHDWLLAYQKEHFSSK
jgi:hypothetical protein